jgi:formamidopyrimidine-DNA glycosylase
MPELPDIVVYIEALEQRILGEPLHEVRIIHPFLLRTVMPDRELLENQPVKELRRLGKRIAIRLANDYWLVLHLMIAGRLHWKEPGFALKPKRHLASLDFSTGSVVLTEAGSKRKAALHIVDSNDALAGFHRGGVEPLEVDIETFKTALRRGNHTLKRALTDPRYFSGIGNAYSDEILFHARLSPLALTQSLNESQIERLFLATQETLQEWIDRLRAEVGDEFPEKITAFHEEMAVHGRYGKPCRACGSPILRIRYATNETNYCAACQTEGRVLADRAFSRLLKRDWPRTLEELEELIRKE